MKIAVVGTGYVGLVTGTCLAESGNEVVCIDKVSAKVELLRRGGMPIYEPGLAELVHRNMSVGRLWFTSDLSKGIADAELIFLAVGTPQSDSGAADLNGIWAAGCEVAAHMTEPKIIVIKSTVPVGTNAGLADRMACVTDIPFDIASNPEFLKEGSAINDFNHPDRVVVGARRPEVLSKLHELYQPFISIDRPFLTMTPESAELTKYVANCLLATKISFINEMSNLCRGYEAVIDDVQRGIGYDKRIGFSFLSPGVGYGGSCFPKDIRAAIHMAKAIGEPARMMEAVDAANEAQKRVLGRTILEYFGETAREKTVAVWGLAFKAETDDIRESPALVLIDDLLRAGVSVRVTDPEAIMNVCAIYGDKLTYFDGQYDALAGADAVAIATEWSVYRHPDYVAMSGLMRRRAIFDGRNLLEASQAARHGFFYCGMGRVAMGVDAWTDMRLDITLEESEDASVEAPVATNAPRKSKRLSTRIARETASFA